MTTTFISKEELCNYLELPLEIVDFTSISFPFTLSATVATRWAQLIQSHYKNSLFPINNDTTNTTTIISSSSSPLIIPIPIFNFLERAKTDFYSSSSSHNNNNNNNNFINPPWDPRPGFEDEHQILPRPPGAFPPPGNFPPVRGESDDNRFGGIRGGYGGYGEGDRQPPPLFGPPGIGTGTGGGMSPTADDPLFHPESRRSRGSNNNTFPPSGARWDDPFPPLG
jgi:hypothetical protein